MIVPPWPTQRLPGRKEARTHRYAFLDSPLPIAFAHRGGAALRAENTMAAFDRAVKAGYRYIETDVRATADHVAVVFHDGDLLRLFGQSGQLADLTWADLASLRGNGESLVPRLLDVLDAWPDCRFNIDIKEDPAVDPTIEAVWKLNARDRVLLASFSDRRIRWIRRLCGPRQATSMGQREVTALRVGSLHGRGLAGFQPGVAAAQVPVWFWGIRVVNARFVRHAHRLNIQVHVWSVDDPAEMHELLDLGVDGIMSDRIDLLREVLIARGCWTLDH